MGADIALEPDILMAAAVEQAGVDDFGDAAFREPLQVVCTALSKDVSLSAAGRAAAFVQLTELLRNRLMVNDVLRRHPEIDNLEVRAPIVICGLPRTGTTHPHNLLPADPVVDYGVRRGQLVEQIVWFSLRGLGLKDEAIRRYYNPKALALFGD